MPSGISYIGSMSVVEASGEITSQAIGDKALLSACADNATLEVDAGTGKLQIKDAGSSLSNGLQRNQASKYAGRWIQGALTASDAVAGVFQIQNTYGTTLVVTDVILLVTTGSTVACTVDVGKGPSAVTSYDNFITAASVASADALSNLTDPGASGGIGAWPANDYINASRLAGATAGLVGFYAVHVLDITS